jgi:hypothetical protein
MPPIHLVLHGAGGLIGGAVGAFLAFVPFGSHTDAGVVISTNIFGSPVGTGAPGLITLFAIVGIVLEHVRQA